MTSPVAVPNLVPSKSCLAPCTGHPSFTATGPAVHGTSPKNTSDVNSGAANHSSESTYPKFALRSMDLIRVKTLTTTVTIRYHIG